LNVGGKVLEKLQIERINHHIFSNSLPQKSTIDAALAAKGFVGKELCNIG
jgi:hypothetical protein